MKRFYHGTSMLIEYIDLSRSRNRTDFGKGFYLGTNLGESRKWAISQSMLHETPTVLRYVLRKEIFDLNDNSLKKLWFSTPSVDWLNFVRDNRRIIAQNNKNAEPRHNYDVVYGPIANDKVVDVVDEYIDGVITADEAIFRVRVIPSVFQLSLHSHLALSYVDQNMTEYQQRSKDNKWSAWKTA